MNIGGTGGVLTTEVLTNRLREGSLVISPILDPAAQIGHGSVDIRLGTRFIINHKPQLSEIDPETLSTQKIRRFQSSFVVPIDGKFMLHPGSFILGSTFEFIALPVDICGFVLSRSGYGRAGLLIATATYVHPGWHGCLTLELENLGEVPIALRPGSRVGQLVLMSAEKMTEPPKLKSIPVGPTFSSLAEDQRWQQLRANLEI